MRWVVAVVVVLASAGELGAICDTKYPDNCRVLFKGGINTQTNLNLCKESAVPSPPAAGNQEFYCKAGVGLCTMDSSGTEHCPGGGAGGGGYQTILSNGGAPLPARTTLNMTSATTGMVTCADNVAASRTDCTWVPSGGPPSGLAGGDLGNTYPNPIVAGLHGQPIVGYSITFLGGELLVNDGFGEWAMGPLTGDLTISGTKVATLAPFGPGATTVGDATHIPVVTTDAKGRVAALSSATILGGGGPTSFSSLTTGTNVGSPNTLMTCGAGCLMNGNIQAQSLQATTPCAGNLYAKGMSTTGTFSCSQVAVPQLAPATSGQMSTLVSDATGSGQLVFGTGPILSSTVLNGTSLIGGVEWWTQTTAAAVGAPGPGTTGMWVNTSGQLCMSTVVGPALQTTCGLGGNVTGPGPTVPANAVATFNGTGGYNLQASPCTIDATGLEDCPAPAGTAQGAIVIKQGQGWPGPANTWALTLGPSALANNFQCVINPATGGFPPACLDPAGAAGQALKMNSAGTAVQFGVLGWAGGGTQSSTPYGGFDQLSPLFGVGQLIGYQATPTPGHNGALAAGTNGQVLTADSTQTYGFKWATPTGGTGGMPGVNSGSTSSWSCSATTGGLFIDTDCNVTCVCESSQAKFCRSDTGVCLSATDCCVAATTTTSTTTTTGASTTSTTTSTTTTTTSGGTALPDWTSSFLAVWRMEEATGANRVSQVSSPTRDMVDVSIAGHPNQDTTNFMEGAASAVSDGINIELATTNATGDVIETPVVNNGLSAGCWMRTTWNDSSTQAAAIYGSFVAGTGGWGIEEIDSTPRYRFFVANASSFFYADPGAADGSARNTFAHVVGTYQAGGAGTDTIKTYVNGANTNTQTGSAGVRLFAPAATYITSLVIENIVADRIEKGNVDECFFSNAVISAADVCRICSCGVSGSKCSCSGTSYFNSGRNVANCGSCTLPACNQATP